MEKDDSIRTHNEQATEYDQQAHEYGWFGGEVLFGLSFEYMNPQDRLLNIGIGTGLSSQPFAKAGLEGWQCRWDLSKIGTLRMPRTWRPFSLIMSIPKLRQC